MMQVIYTHEDMPETFTKSLFLAGPSLRPGQEKDMVSWRKDALDILQDIGFDGVVFVPENRDGKFQEDFSYDNQIEWEDKYLNLSDCIVFWVPRNLGMDEKDNLKLPGFTTNVEWGAWASSGKVVFGAPEDAEKVTYLKYYAEEFKVPVSDTLTDTLRSAMDKLGEGAERSGGERYVPLFVWQLPSFQSWYQTQKAVGNTLNHAKLLYTFRPGYKDFVFLWILKVSVHVKSENRNKDNEFVLARPDIACVLLWNNPDRPRSWQDHKVILIKEFRSPANTKDGFVRELPSGSLDGDEPKEAAAKELHEETSFYLEPERLQSHGSCQLMGTFSSHKAYLYSAEISNEEMEWFQSQQDIVHGKIEDTERTFIEVYTIQDLLNNQLVDWSTLGMILSVLAK